ncbi:MAG: hypothetical protein ACLR23_21310 [Clostridia bacterium]
MHASSWSNRAAVSGHTQTKFPATTVKTTMLAGNVDENARRFGAQQQDQRAHAAKFPAITVETIMPAEKRREKCTPARRVTAAVSGQRWQIPAITVETTMPAGKQNENARRRVPTAADSGQRSQIPRRHRQDDRTGGEME